MVEKKIPPYNFPSRFHGNIEPQSVLICDDEELMRQVTGQMLQRVGYSVLYASNGDETVEVFKSCLTGVDLVIMDLSMPGESGLEVYRRLKNIDSSVRVIFSSGYVNDNRLTEAEKEGAAGFLHKPYTMDKLLRTVHSILGKPAFSRSGRIQDA